MQAESCDRVWDFLSAYADGMASAEESLVVESHVALCESCASDLAFMRRTSCVLMGAEQMEPPAHLRSAILAATIDRVGWRDKLARALAERRFRPGIPGLALGGAALALVLLVLTRSAPYQAPVASRGLTATQPNKLVDAIRSVPSGKDSRVASQPDAGLGGGAGHPAELSNTSPKRDNAPDTTQPREGLRFANLATPVGPLTKSHSEVGAPRSGGAPVPANVSSARSRPRLNPEVVEPPMTSDGMPAPPMMMPEGMRVAERDVVDPGPPAVNPAPSTNTGRIILAASNSSLGISPKDAAGLAGLRGTLGDQRRMSERMLSAAMYRSNEANQVTFDLFKSRF